jgi:hypothetical protein
MTGMLKYFNMTKEDPRCKDNKMIEANTMGFRRGSKFSEKILRGAAKYAQIEECIVPPGNESPYYFYIYSSIRIGP